MRVAILALLLLAPAVAGTAAADQQPAWHEADRRLEAEWDQAGFLIRSTRASDPAADSITYRFDAEAARLDVALSAVRPEPTDLEATLTWRSLLEAQDQDGDGRHSLGDPIVQQLEFEDLGVMRVEVETLPGGHRHATVAYGLPGGGQAVLTFTATPHLDPIEGPHRAPASLAWAIQVESFPFESDNQTRLVVDARWEPALGHRSDALERTQDGYRMRYLWDPEGVGERSAVPANVTVEHYAGPRPSTLVFTALDVGPELRHAGRIAFDRPPDEGLAQEILQDIRGRWPLYLIGAALAGLLVWAPVAARRRRP